MKQFLKVFAWVFCGVIILVAIVNLVEMQKRAKQEQQQLSEQSIQAAAQEADILYSFVCMRAGINIRTGPGTNFPKDPSGTTVTGEYIYVLEKKDDWVRFRVTKESVGWEGWVYEPLARKQPTAASQSRGDVSGSYVCSKSGVHIYERADVTSPTIGETIAGTRHTILKKSGRWLNIQSSHYSGWVYEHSTGESLSPGTVAGTGKRTTTRRSTPGFMSEKALPVQSTESVVQVMRDTGLLKRFDIDANQAWVSPLMWYGLDVHTKERAARILAQACDNAGSTGRVVIYDNMSGKKLAKYSMAWGFKVY